MIQTSSLIADSREPGKCQHSRIGVIEQLESELGFLEKDVNLEICSQKVCRYKGACQLVLGPSRHKFRKYGVFVASNQCPGSRSCQEEMSNSL
jgi:hypothetical protein